jgi:hypothetical protein
MTEVKSSDVDLSEILSSVDGAAKRLNKISNNANEVITSVENRLLRANIGMEIWWDTSIMWADCSNELGRYEQSTWAGRLLGFAKINGEWCLGVKTVRWVKGYHEGDPDSEYTTEHLLDEPTQLRRASRDVRLAALKKMPEFLAFLAKAVEDAVAEMETTTEALLPKKGK